MRSRTVRDVVKGQAVLELAPTVTVRAAAGCMRDRKVGSVMVMKDGKLAGIFTERDGLFRVLADGLNPDTTSLAAVMTTGVATIAADASLLDALRMMHEGGYRHVPVMDGGVPLGIVSIRDALGVELDRFNRELADKKDLEERLA